MSGRYFCRSFYFIADAIYWKKHSNPVPLTEFRCRRGSHHGSLVVNRYALFVDSTSNTALVANVEQLRRQSVGNVHHSSWYDSRFVQRFNYVFASLWL